MLRSVVDANLPWCDNLPKHSRLVSPTFSRKLPSVEPPYSRANERPRARPSATPQQRIGEVTSLMYMSNRPFRHIWIPPFCFVIPDVSALPLKLSYYIIMS